MFDIQEGQPATTKHSHRTKYPFGKLTIGTFFEVPADHPSAKLHPTRRAAPVQHAAHSYGRIHGLAFRTERTETGAIRVYRVK